MKIKNRGYIVPVAIGVLVVASLGLLMFSNWGGKKVTEKTGVSNTPVTPTTTTNVSNRQSASDDATLDADSVNIDAQLKALDGSNSDVDSSLKDTSSI